MKRASLSPRGHIRRTPFVCLIGAALMALPAFAQTDGPWTHDGTVVRLTNSTDRVGIGTARPKASLDVSGVIRTSGSAPNFEGATNVNLVAGGNNTGEVALWTTTAGQLAERVRILNNGNVGIGTTNPQTNLDVSGVVRTSGPNPNFEGATNVNLVAGGNNTGEVKLWTTTAGQLAERVRILNNGNVGIGTPNPQTSLDVSGVVRTSGTNPNFEGATNVNLVAGGNNTGEVKLWTTIAGRLTEQVRILNNGNVGIGTTNPQAKLDVAGRTRTAVLEIIGGSDLAEPFEFSVADVIKPGMVVAIDPERPGRLRMANTAYDRSVAGIVSGANGINAGLTMNQEGTVAKGSLPVALTGRVYCWADTSYGAIKPGDLLTTSDTPGHAMRVGDHSKAQGAIIGKAMTELKQGTGPVLVLVTLQ